MTMFKPKASMSPVKASSSQAGSPTKRKHEPSPSKGVNNHAGQASGKSSKKVKLDNSGAQQQDANTGDGLEPKFTFEEVKTMLDNLLEQKGKAVTVAVSAGLKHVDFEEVAVPGHSVQSCRQLVEKLIFNTRRVRTLQEVLLDIKSNLNKRSYTEAIQRATLDVPPPKKPPSAYLLYHKERYESLRGEIAQASEIAKIVSEEWKTLDERRRLQYQKRHNELAKKYAKDLKKCGLGAKQKPKRSRSAKAMYAQSRIEEICEVEDLDKDDIAKLKEQYIQEYEEQDKETKAYWQKQYQLEQERYRRERNEYIAANPHLDHHVPERVRASRYAIKPPPAPKSALKFYLAKKIPDGLEGQELEDVKLKLRAKFFKLSEKKQLKYIKKAIKDKERYEAEVAEFRTAHPEVAIPKLKPNVSRDQWKLYEALIENKPVAPAPTAYLHFCGKLLSDTQDAQVPTQRMQSASVAWSSLSEKEKLNIEKEHVATIKEFLVEMEDWLLKQDEKRRDQVWKDEPRCRPDYWRKRVARMEKNLAKKQQK